MSGKKYIGIIPGANYQAVFASKHGPWSCEIVAFVLHVDEDGEPEIIPWVSAGSYLEPADEDVIGILAPGADASSFKDDSQRRYEASQKKIDTANESARLFEEAFKVLGQETGYKLLDWAEEYWAEQKAAFNRSQSPLSKAYSHRPQKIVHLSKETREYLVKRLDELKMKKADNARS